MRCEGGERGEAEDGPSRGGALISKLTLENTSTFSKHKPSGPLPTLSSTSYTHLTTKMDSNTTTLDCTAACAQMDASNTTVNALPLVTVAFEPRKTSMATVMGAAQTKTEAESTTESETESEEGDNDSDSDNDCASVSELLASASELTAGIRALVSLCINDKDACSLPAVQDDGEDNVAETHDIPALLARIKELEADNERLQHDMELCRCAAIELDDLYSVAQSRNTELEAHIRLYDHHLSSAQIRVAKLEMELHENNRVESAVHARLAELETKLHEYDHRYSTAEACIAELADEKKRLEDDMELCRDVALEVDDLYSVAEARNAELEAHIRQYGHHLFIAESRVAELETKIHALDHRTEARITELKADNERLQDDMELSRGAAVKLADMHVIAEARIAELEADIVTKAASTTAPTKSKTMRCEGRVAPLPPKHPGLPVLMLCVAEPVPYFPSISTRGRIEQATAV